MSQGRRSGKCLTAVPINNDITNFSLCEIPKRIMPKLGQLSENSSRRVAVLDQIACRSRLSTACKWQRRGLLIKRFVRTSFPTYPQQVSVSFHVKINIYLLIYVVQLKWFGGVRSTTTQQHQWISENEENYQSSSSHEDPSSSNPRKRGRPPKNAHDDRSMPPAKKTKTGAGVNGKGKAKAKEIDMQQDVVEVTDEEGAVDDEERVEICMYVNVETPPPPMLRVGGRVTKAPAIKITPRGPFILYSTASYTEFLSVIAKGVVAGSTDCLTRALMEWRFDRPQNAAKKPVTNEMGYKVMMKTILERKKDHCVTVSMPPPTKHVNDVVSHNRDIRICVLYLCHLFSLGVLLLLMRMTEMTESRLTMTIQLTS